MRVSLFPLSYSVFSVILLVLEAPILGYCIPQLEFIIKLTTHVKNWMRMIAYPIVVIVILALCVSISTLIAQGLLFLLAVFYFVLTIGAKGDHTDEYVAKYHNKSGEIDMILQEDMEDSDDEEIQIHSGANQSK